MGKANRAAVKTTGLQRTVRDADSAPPVHVHTD